MFRPWQIVIASVAALALSACTGGGATTENGSDPTGDTGDGTLSGEISFQTWSLKNDRFTPYFEDLVSSFETENPGVTVTWTDQPGDGYEEKLLQQANSDTLPDVINLSEGLAYSLAKAGQLRDLEEADAETLDLYVEGAVEAYDYEDIEGSFGYPWYLGTDLNFWNMATLEGAGVEESDLPDSIDSLFELGTKLASEPGSNIKLISEMPGLGAISNAGIEVFSDNEFTFNSPEAVDLIQKYADAYAAGAMPPEALTGDYLGNSELFKQGKVAWTTGSAGFASELDSDAPNILADSVTTPRFGVPPLFVQGISVSQNSANPELALAFAQYATNDANQVEFLKLAQGFFPGTKESNENPEAFTSVIENEKQKVATEQAAKVIGDAKIDKPVQWTDAMDTYLRQQLALSVRGDVPVQESLDKAVQNANDTM